MLYQVRRTRVGEDVATPIALQTARTQKEHMPAEVSFDWLDRYNVVWDTQSKDASESMPMGGGDIGCNVWVEGGDILLYLSRSGTFDENNQMLKLGRIRITLDPNPFGVDAASFRQELVLREGRVQIEGRSASTSATLQLWCEVDRPVIHIDVAASTGPVSITATYESWRTVDRPLPKDERMACLGFLDTEPDNIPLLTRADTVEHGEDRVLWFHRNDNSDLVFDKEVTQQHLDAVKDRMWNPLEDLIFGGIMTGPNLEHAGTTSGRYQSTDFNGYSLRSNAPSTEHHVDIFLHTAQAADEAEWREDLEELAGEDELTREDARDDTDAWWQLFWKRSRIAINIDRTNTHDEAWQVGRNYQLFRYCLGCNAYSEAPTKFNGSLFTYDPVLVELDHDRRNYEAATPDFRQWGGGSFTAQNQRLVYWPMLKSGDFDMMTSQFDFYLMAQSNAELRTEVYWGHGGACFTEQMNNYGLPIGHAYGWQDGKLGPRDSGEKGVQDNKWVDYQYDTALEFCLMMLDVERFTGEDVTGYIPLIESCLTFFDEHYQLRHRRRNEEPFNDSGNLVLFPSTACETYKGATNPTNVVVGLKTVLRRLLELPASYLTAEQRQRWQTMLGRIPPVNYREREGRRTISPAAEWERINNVELPQLYPVFPWGQFGLGQPDLQAAIDTWRYGVDRPNQRNHISWHQDAIFCARLGLTDEAAELTVKKLGDSGRRFPTFWGPGHDWVPDHNWGGSGMIGLQEMLMQTDGRVIRLLPAWPASWDVDFKLHAPYQTVIEGQVRGGKVEKLQVTPQERRRDVVVGNGG